MSARFTLKSLEISNYRGVRDTINIPLDKFLNIIYGANGSGKSSITTAIEWVLYPKETLKLKYCGIYERRDWEVRYIHTNDEPVIKMTLTKGSEHLMVEPATRDSIHCSYNDFKSLAYIHQESLRSFIIGTAGEREKIFQRLLGAGWAQDLAKAFSDAKKELKCDEADDQVQKLNDSINERMQEAGRLLDEADREARILELQPPWPKAAQSQISKVRQMITDLCQDAGINVPDLPVDEPYSGYHSRLSPILNDLRTKGPTGELQRLQERKIHIESALFEYSQASYTLAKAIKALDSALETFGDEKKIMQLIARLKMEIAGIENELASLDLKRAVIRAAVGYLQQSPDETYCPVCDSSIKADLTDKLKGILEKEKSQIEHELEERLRILRQAVEECQKSLIELKRLREVVERCKTSLSDAIEALGKLLSLEIRENEDIGAVAQAEIDNLNRQIDAILNLVRQYQERISQIEDEARKVDKIGQILLLQNRINHLDTIRETSEWRTLCEAQQDLSRREQLWKIMEEAMRTIAAEVARRNLIHAREPITQIFHKLTQRNDFPVVDIVPDKNFAIRVSSLAIEEPAYQAATAILNLTDLNALAIAVVGGMAISFPNVHDFGFLILDDPSQDMDPQVAARLGEVISDISEKIQVIVATPDPDLLEALKKSPRLKNVIRLKPRSTQEVEPRVQIESII
jgi:exonuclease SbcC